MDEKSLQEEPVGMLARLASLASGIIGRIAILAALSALPVVAVMLQTSLEMREAAIDRAVEDLERIVRSEAADQNEKYAALAQLLGVLARDRSLLGSGGDCSLRLAEISAHSTRYSNLYVANASGDIVCSAESLPQPVNLADRDYFTLAMKVREPVFGQTVISRRTGRPVLPMAVGIPDEQGKNIGVVATSIDVHDMLSRIAEHNGQSETVITMLGRDGKLVGRYPPLEGAIGQSQSDTPLFRAAAQLGDRGERAEIEGLDGVLRIYGIAHLEYGKLNMWLTAGLPRSVVLRSVEATFRQKLGILALAFALVLVIAIVIGNSSLRRPVLRLSRTAVRLAAGEADARVGLHSGARELVELSRNFDLMAGESQKRIELQARTNEELRAAKESVEEKVAARTRDLEKVSEQAMARNAALAKTTHTLSTLSEMTDMLQTVGILSDVKPIIEQAAAQLFPDNGGSVFLFRESRNMLEPLGSWGELANPRPFSPHECMAVRLGRNYRVDPGEAKIRCTHVSGDLRGYTCVPMSAQGVVLGTLTLALGADEEANDQATQLCELVVERLALAVANVRLRQQLRDISIKDSLTGLYNRRFAEEILGHELPRTLREQSNLCVLMLDLDHFKRFNDTYGHEVGDRLLQQAGALLQAIFREADVCCRYGGEEFLVFMPNTDPVAAKQRAEHLREEMKRIHFVHQGTVIGDVSVSIGLAGFPDPINDGNSLLAAADAALYKAKSKGRDQVCIATAVASRGVGAGPRIAQVRASALPAR